MIRRKFLSQFGTATILASLSGAVRSEEKNSNTGGLDPGRAISALDYGVLPGSGTDQSIPFQKMLDAASAQSQPIFLPAGNYVVSEIRLPLQTVLSGVPGKSNLVFGGRGALLRAENVERVFLENLTFDGIGDRASTDSEGLIDLRGVDALSIRDCVVRRAATNGIYAENCAGRITGNSISDAGQFAVFARQGQGLTISDNAIRSCLNGGIVVHRHEQGDDGTIITGNRIADTSASEGGTGEWGNAINVFRTDHVIIANNIITGSAFSAIRANSARGIHIIGNNCRDSGETAIYAEFAFEDALIANNLIEGAANGISVTNFDSGGKGATVSGNIVRGLRREGPYEASGPGFGTGIGVEADTTVVGNMVDGAPLFGINAGWGEYLRDVVIASNVVRNARMGIGISAAPGAGTATVTGNVIGARQGAILAHEWGKPVSPDLVASPQDSPSNIILSGNSATPL